VIDSLNTEQHKLAEKARENMHQRDKVFRRSMYVFLTAMFAGLIGLAIVVYVLYDTRGHQLNSINDDLKTVCRTTEDKDAPALDTCSKAERGELIAAPNDPDFNDPDPDDPEFQDPEFQDSEIQEGESQEPENQESEEQNAEENDPDPDDPETQDPEIQDPEIDDPDPAIPGPQGPPGTDGSDGKDGVGVSSLSFGMSGSQCILQIKYTDGSLQNVPVPIVFCVP